MGQDQLSKDKADEFLDQRAHVVATTQELRHSTRNFVRMTGHYLGTEGPLSRVMEPWPHHVDRFKHQYNKAFAGHRLFGADIVDCIHKRVQLFLHSCNTTSLEDVESGALAESGEMQRNFIGLDSSGSRF